MLTSLPSCPYSLQFGAPFSISYCSENQKFIVVDIKVKVNMRIIPELMVREELNLNLIV